VAGEVPRRSLGLLSVLAFLALAVVTATDVSVRPLVLLTTALLVAVYAVGVAAAVRLLPLHTRAGVAALAALAAVGLLLAMSGPYLALPLLLAVAAAIYVRRRQRSAPGVAREFAQVGKPEACGGALLE
jgi:amino acid efflux transporter